MNPQHYGLVVGINRYPGISDLTGARADAKAFAEWLADPLGGGLPPGHLKTVLATESEEQRYVQAQGAKPTSLEIDYALKELTDAVKRALIENAGVWSQTRLYVYVAGHGFAPQGGQGALFLANAEAGALSRNIELRKYLDWCTECAWFSEVVVFADCCRNRLPGGAQGFGPQLDPCPAPWGGGATTWVVGFGSELGSESFEHEDGGMPDEARGYFTAALLEGLKGGASVDPITGAITHQTLAGYVRSLVRERTKGHQDADINGPAGATVAFGRPPARALRTVRITFPAGFTGAARLLKDGQKVADLQGGGTVTVSLTDGIYEVAAVPEGSAEFANDGLFKVAGKARDVTL